MLEDLYLTFDNRLSYGRGLMVCDHAEGHWLEAVGRAFWRRSGRTRHISFSPAKQSIVAVALTGQGFVEAAANLLFGVLENERLDLDSLIHHVNILEMNGESYRLNRSCSRMKSNTQ